MKILLAIDGSAHSEFPIKELASMQSLTKIEIRIIHVFSNPSNIDPEEDVNLLDDYSTEISQATFKQAKKITNEAMEYIHKKNPDVLVTTVEKDGSPAHIILEEAKIFGANLIVIGSHGHGAVEGFLLGSVAQTVALHAKCSVEIVRNKKIKNKF